ncbi:electron transfer flavoprotein alpha subunit apoprotein [Halanaerobium saccharolyticum]|uniref:Electron transfer flavoprotein alpha subunit apoprotein n=1 Tax=Halanaerobium saccharolyticum TaxID=43595 RepID=A0A4R6LJV3_9FIRM|nr:electron transfer flavoprotein subunit alpha/FixB family protein [Halanaerobium saccharolyticum]TDO84351.1 electron transfer flavoprotein alpha subunit apoprotein [Halanaerobium saccharolyticum]
MKKSLVYIDPENVQNSIEILEVVAQIHQEEDFKSYGALINNSTSIQGLHQFDYIINIQNQNLKNYDPVAVTDVMEQLNKKYNFDSIIIPATHFGRMLAPRLAMRLHVGLVADVTKINHNGENLELVRPAFSGRIMAGIITEARKPIMLSVRQNVFAYDVQADKEAEVIDYQPENFKQGEIELLNIQENNISYDIRESEILVSGGGGTLKNFDQIKLLADKLNAEVSASRKIIDNGKADRNIQVGQSGKTVSPDLYIALGISGAIEHVAGLKNIDNIIAVNINKSAPICSLSDIVVEGDALEFVKKLSDKIDENEDQKN